MGRCAKAALCVLTLSAAWLRFLYNAYGALHGYTFKRAAMNDFYYGPGASRRLPATCRFEQDPAYDRTTRDSRLSPAEFRRQVEIRDYYRSLPDD